jgi:REP element-mobilizing transposase RayT
MTTKQYTDGVKQAGHKPETPNRPPLRRRRSIRLRDSDYTQAGVYFLTICTQNRECMFGAVVEGKMVLNEAGKMVQTVWDEIPEHYPGIETDAFVIMPNHIHGIVVIVGQPQGDGQPQGVAPTGGINAIRDFVNTPVVGAGPRARPDPRACPSDAGHPQEVAPTLSLPDVAHRFKTMTTKRYTDGVKQTGWRPFPGKLWQRNYWEHIVRNEEELHRIRQYIHSNPAQWEEDALNRK